MINDFAFFMIKGIAQKHSIFFILRFWGFVKSSENLKNTVKSTLFQKYKQYLKSFLGKLFDFWGMIFGFWERFWESLI